MGNKFSCPRLISCIKGGMSSHPTGLQTDDRNLLQNNKAVRECIPYVFRKVIEWGCPKDFSKSFLDYYSTLPTYNEKIAKRLNKEKKFEQIDTGDFDVTYLHELAGLVCDSLEITGTEPWRLKMKDTSSLEYLMGEAKMLRNEVVHNLQEAVKSDALPKIEKVCKEIMETSAVLYKKIADVERKDLDDKFSQIKGLGLNDIEIVSYITEKMKSYAPAELVDAWLKNDTKQSVSVPILSKHPMRRDKIFYKTHLSKPDKNNPSKIITLPCNEIFSNHNESIKVINGAPGSGKTTLMRVLVDKWVEMKSGTSVDWTFAGIDQFQLLVLIEARSVKKDCYDLGTLVKVNYPKTLGFLSKESIVDAMGNLDVLFLIDGFDEATKDTKEMILNIFERFRYITSWTIVTSSRPYASDDLCRELEKKSLIYEELSMEPLTNSDQQIKLLQKYQQEMFQDSLNVDVVTSFMNLPPEVTRIFVHPIFLSMFCVLHASDPNLMKNWTSEINLFASSYDYMCENVKDRIEGNNPSKRASDIMKVTSAFSLNMFLDSSFHLHKYDFEELIENCEDKIHQDLNYENALSCIFSKETSYTSPGTVTYQFFHASFQEYLISRHIAEKIRKLKRNESKEKNCIRTILETESDSPISDSDIARFGNVLKYLTLELQRTSNLERNIRHLKEVFEDIHATFKYCSELLVCSGFDELLVSTLAELVKEDIWQRWWLTSAGERKTVERSGWRITSERFVKPTAHLLQQGAQPSVLHLDMLKGNAVTESSLMELMAAIGQNFTGELWLQVRQTDNQDSSVRLLKNAKFNLKRFRGYLSSKEAIEVLAEVGSGARFYMRVGGDALRSIHLLEGVPEHTGPQVSYIHNKDNLVSLPLSAGGNPPDLNILEANERCPKKMAEFIKTLVPKMKQFEDLTLTHCTLGDEDLKSLLTELHTFGIRTKSVGETRFYIYTSKDDGDCTNCVDKHSDGVRCLALHLTEETIK